MRQTAQLTEKLRLVSALQIADEIVRPDFECGIVAPLVRIAHFDAEARQFLFGLRLGLRPHPLQRVDGLLEGTAQIGDELADALARGGREVLLDIQATGDFADRPVDQAQAATPARLLSLNAAERALAELESRAIERLGKEGRVGIEQPIAEVLAPVIDGRRLHEGCKIAQVGWLADVELGNARGLRAHALEEGRPLELR